MSIRVDHGGSLDVVHEINVTPFIDVVLVLLIIFMIVAPLANVDIPVDLPTANAATGAPGRTTLLDRQG
jgi:biopolymer transport protein ExbD